MKSLDTETTGIDLYHGALPYIVTTCNEEWENVWWEWDVDPLTREPEIPRTDVDEIIDFVDESDEIVLQNPKFDVAALGRVFKRLHREYPQDMRYEWYAKYGWPWEKTKDTLVNGHLLASNHQHNLTAMAIEYLAINIQKYEDALEVAVKKCRGLVTRKDSPIGDWMIAKHGLAGMPSAKKSANKQEEKVWKFDTWLPRAIVKAAREGEEEIREYLSNALTEEELESFETVAVEYANPDSSTTLALYKEQQRRIAARKLTAICEESLKVIPCIYEMEERGVTYNRGRLRKLRDEYRVESDRLNTVCLNIAAKYEYPQPESKKKNAPVTVRPYELELPKAGNNNSLKTFVFDVMKLPPVKFTDTGPSLDKDVIEHYELTLEGDEKEFITSLSQKRKRDTALSYMDGYERFAIPIVDQREIKRNDDWVILHPSVNQTGTDTLRGSSSNPNEQNISKKEGFNLRYLFGPTPDREWWSLDASNIELRIPAYEANEADMVALFERPDDPPYYGGNHLLNFHTVYPDLWDEAVSKVGWEEAAKYIKKQYKSTWYQYCKNGGFAVQYGSVEGSGTADRAFHRVGSFSRLKSRFTAIHGPGGLNEQQIAHARRHGYVETMPDKSIDPERGYPLLCTRSEYGDIVPTVPLNYHVQGTAMWWMRRAMVRCRAKLMEWRRSGFLAYIIMQIHDELVFDLPRGRGPKPWLTNLPRVKVLARTMSLGGEDIGVPTPVGIEYHPENWSEGITI